MILNTLQLFFQLLQVAVGNRDKLTLCPLRQAQDKLDSGQVCLSEKEWAFLYAMCQRQSLVGIGFAGISRLPSEQRPPLCQLAQWIHDGEKIKEKNERISRECAELCRQLEKDGMNCCILKGQSNLVNYPEWLRDYRTPGDIDVLIRPKYGSGVRGAIEYCIGKCHEKNVPVGKICYHHMELPFFHADVNVDANSDYTEVEAHHRATWLNCYFRNRRLQHWLENNMPFGHEQAQIGEAVFPIPTPSYNAVYQLLHIYKHLFEEGIGLRQLLDYYFVLREPPSSSPQGGVICREEIMHTLSRFGMKKFASAVMWVLSTVFTTTDCTDNTDKLTWQERWPWMLCEPNEKEGKLLLHEIMMTGNFGKYDSRISHGGNALHRNWKKLKHNFRLIRHYPEEVLWEPVFRLFHYLWRKLELWRY